MRLDIFQDRMRIVPESNAESAFIDHVVKEKDHHNVIFEIKRAFDHEIDCKISNKLGQSTAISYLEWKKKEGKES